MEETHSRGSRAAWDLADVTPLCRPWRADAWGVERPELNEGLLRLSSALAASAYDMELSPWLAAGWRDATIQVNGELAREEAAERTESEKPRRGLSRLLETVKMRFVRQKIQPRGPLGQVLGAVRQLRGGSGTGKAVVMLHKTPDGRYVVAIGFMGTGKQLSDWFSNFRMTAEEGMHRGFLQLARQFEGNESAILFPETARELGLESLSLKDVLAECRREDSRFLIWMAGHSQGGAMMQAWTRLKILEDGVLARNLIGCGFASPTVCTGLCEAQPALYPLYHVVNSDDPVPRVGGQVHLGQALLYPAGDAFRRACYRFAPDDPLRRARELAVREVVRTRSMTDCLVVMVAYLTLMQNSAAGEVASMLGFARGAGWTRLLGVADNRVADLLRATSRKCDAAYFSIAGRRMSRAQVKRCMRRLQAVADEVGLRGLMQGMLQWTGAAHAMTDGENGEPGAYPTIVMEGAKALTPAVWTGGLLPLLMRQDGKTPLIVRKNATCARRAAVHPHRARPRNSWRKR